MADEAFAAHLRNKALRYEEIKHLGDRVESLGASHARACYQVKLDEDTEDLSDKDLIILCDRGNGCFGGHVHTRGGDSVLVDIYTD